MNLRGISAPQTSRPTGIGRQQHTPPNTMRYQANSRVVVAADELDKGAHRNQGADEGRKNATHREPAARHARSNSRQFLLEVVGRRRKHGGMARKKENSAAVLRDSRGKQPANDGRAPSARFGNIASACANPTAKARRQLRSSTVGVLMTCLRRSPTD